MQLKTLGVIALYAVLLLAFCLLAAHPYVRPAVIYDEGFALTNALRILNGEAPFADFWTVYPPGTSGTLAVFFALLDESIEISRLVHVMWAGILVTATHYLTFSVTTKLIAVPTAVLVGAWTCLGFTPSYSMLPAIALSVSSLAVLLRGCQNGKQSQAVLGGTVAGLVLFFRHDLSAYLFVSAVAGYFYLHMQRHNPDATRYRMLVGHYVVFQGGTALLGLIVILMLSGTETFFDQAISFAGSVQRDQRFLPFPSLLAVWDTSTDLALWSLAWTGPITIFFVALSLGIWGQSLPVTNRLLATTTGTLSLLLLFQAFGRLDLIHVTPSLICLTVTVCAMSPIWFDRTRATARRCVTLMAIAFVTWSATELSKHLHTGTVVSCLSSGGCLRTSADQNAAVDFINTNFSSAEPIFVGNGRHDRIFINDALLYFRLNRPVPTKWSEMHPGEVTTAKVQSQIMEELENSPVEVVVLVDIPSGFEDNSSAISSGIYILDTYLFSNFSTIWRQGRYTVLVRNNRIGRPSVTQIPR